MDGTSTPRSRPTAAAALALATLSALACGQEGARPQNEGASTSPALRQRLTALMRAGIETKQPNKSFVRRLEGTTSVFDGSYDWHSCVIAHWALLSEGRHSGDDALVAWVLDRLPPSALQAEFDTLILREGRAHRRARGTAPYDTCWYAMLLSEIAQHGDNPKVDGDALRTLRIQLEERIIESLENAPFPERPARGDRPALYIGSYRSFLLAWVLLSWSDPVSEAAVAALPAWWDDRIAPKLDELDQLDAAHPFDFVWVPAVLDLARQQRRDASPSPSERAYDPGDPGDLPVSVTVPTVHPVGLWLSRFWPVAAAAAQGDAPALKRFDEAWAVYLEREDLWAEDFPACSHWVPQFLYIGLWLADGGGN